MRTEISSVFHLMGGAGESVASAHIGAGVYLSKVELAYAIYFAGVEVSTASFGIRIDDMQNTSLQQSTSNATIAATGTVYFDSASR